MGSYKTVSTTLMSTPEEYADHVRFTFLLYAKSSLEDGLDYLHNSILQLHKEIEFLKRSVDERR